jgi:putative Mg2+ transporter-C (MgtC) family protein
MPLTLSWQEIALRLTLSVAAGGSLAGIAASTAVRLDSAPPYSLSGGSDSPDPNQSSTAHDTLDLMRLPLGILTGMGFIGGGAILRRENFVTGVTTAATLWFVTVIGLCFGVGRFRLGSQHRSWACWF